MNPEDVNPGNYSIEKIIYKSDQGYSIAVGIWNKSGSRHYAIRWDLDRDNPNDKGYPVSNGNPMWFMLPANLKELIGVLPTEPDNDNPEGIIVGNTVFLKTGSAPMGVAKIVQNDATCQWQEKGTSKKEVYAIPLLTKEKPKEEPMSLFSM